MGGLALKQLNVQRIPAERYKELSALVQQRFTTLFGQRPDIVPSYAQKPDFGDCDMIVTSAELPALWREGLAAASSSRGWLVNGDVTSMEVENVQFDFISVPRKARDFAYVYFAFNDLGNLMGRVAHRMGFKYGHLGFQRVLRDGGHIYATIDTTEDVAEVFDFLGYDYARWQQGFATLEEIFQFTASSQYFNPDIYLLHNRNAASRIRDAKRKTYMEFLQWCENTTGLTRWPWHTDSDMKADDWSVHLARARARWPEFAKRIDAQVAEHAKYLDMKTRWNGDNVKQWTGLSGKPLGEFMAEVRARPGFTSASEHVEVLEDFVRAVFDERFPFGHYHSDRH
jgi:hypothetical protein